MEAGWRQAVCRIHLGINKTHRDFGGVRFIIREIVVQYKWMLWIELCSTFYFQWFGNCPRVAVCTL